MNNKRIGKIAITLILGTISAISGFVAAEILKESEEKCTVVNIHKDSLDEKDL